MQVVLRQTFPLGRFHATPWRANPFDDPYGEWPPSPWRLIRAITARWYQWAREMGVDETRSLERLIVAFCRSRLSFVLPAEARRGLALRQYHPVEFSWKPKENKKGTIPQKRAYGTTLVQDNYWSVPPKEAVWWVLDGDEWSDDLLNLLDRCLERIVYFGRAESLTELRRWTCLLPGGVTPNCELGGTRRSRHDVPVLAPLPDASPAQIQCITDQPDVRGSTVPPGTVWMFARRPLAVPLRSPSRLSFQESAPRHLVQFAITGAVLPEMRATVRVTSRFRQRVLDRFAQGCTGERGTRWRQAPREVRKQAVFLSGLDPEQGKLRNHEHVWFLVWSEAGVPARLLVWRAGTPFTSEENVAMMSAAEREISWGTVPVCGEWTLRLLPLDTAVPPPPGFDGQSYALWESVTPYVPPRHRFRRGKPREGEEIISQIRRELDARGWAAARAEIEVVGDPQWTAVHLPPSQKRFRPFIGDRSGFAVRIRFDEPAAGPIMLGHSAHFGLGLFAPRQSRGACYEP